MVWTFNLGIAAGPFLALLLVLVIVVNGILAVRGRRP